METSDYRNLTVWQKAIDLVVEIYGLTSKLPKDELFGLTNQLRRAAVSIPSNIAEGNGRGSTKEYLHFLYIARGSKSEVETQLMICLALKYLKESDIENALGLCTEISKMLNKLILKLNKKENI